MKSRKKTILKLTKNKRKNQCYYIQNSDFSKDNRTGMRYLCKMTYTIPFYDIIQMNTFKNKFYHLLNERQVTKNRKID